MVCDLRTLKMGIGKNETQKHVHCTKCRRKFPPLRTVMGLNKIQNSILKELALLLPNNTILTNILTSFEVFNLHKGPKR